MNIAILMCGKGLTAEEAVRFERNVKIFRASQEIDPDASYYKHAAKTGVPSSFVFENTDEGIAYWLAAVERLKRQDVFQWLMSFGIAADTARSLILQSDGDAEGLMRDGRTISTLLEEFAVWADPAEGHDFWSDLRRGINDRIVESVAIERSKLANKAAQKALE